MKEGQQTTDMIVPQNQLFLLPCRRVSMQNLMQLRNFIWSHQQTKLIGVISSYMSQLSLAWCVHLLWGRSESAWFTMVVQMTGLVDVVEWFQSIISWVLILIYPPSSQYIFITIQWLILLSLFDLHDYKLKSPRLIFSEPLTALGGYRREEAIILLRKFYITENTNGMLTWIFVLCDSSLAEALSFVFFVSVLISTSPQEKDKQSFEARHTQFVTSFCIIYLQKFILVMISLCSNSTSFAWWFIIHLSCWFLLRHEWVSNHIFIQKVWTIYF